MPGKMKNSRATDYEFSVFINCPFDRAYQRFKSRLPTLCRDLKLQRSEMTFNDFTNIVTEWLKTELRMTAI
jgi:hypothetical protein